MLTRATMALVCLIWCLPASASTLNAVLSCPGGANDPNNPSNPQAESYSYKNAYWSKPQCRLYLSAAGSDPIHNVVATITMPQTIATLHGPQLPDGDVTYGKSELKMNWTSGAMKPGAGTPTGAWNPAEQTYTWTFETFSPGESKILNLKSGSPINGSYPAGEHWISATVTSDDAPKVPEQLVPIVIEPGHSGKWQLTAPAQVSAKGSYTFSGNYRPVAWDWGKFPVHANVQYRLYMPYRDTMSGEILADGAYNPAAENHALLIDPELALVELRRGNAVKAFKDEGALTAPEAGALNAGKIIQWHPKGGYYTLDVGSMHQKVFYGWTVDAGWAASVQDDEEIPVRQCVFSDTMDALLGGPKCKDAVIVIGPELQPKLSITHRRSTSGNKVAESEKNRLGWTETGSTRWHLVNPTSKTLTKATTSLQLPGDQSGAQTRFRGACWNSNVPVNPMAAPYFDADNDLNYGIYVSVAPAKYGAADNIASWQVPASKAKWLRCDNVDKDQQCCKLAELEALGVDPAHVGEVHFVAPEVGPDATWFKATNAAHVFGGWMSWYVLETAINSIDGLPHKFVANDMSHASIGSKAAAYWSVFSGGGTVEAKPVAAKLKGAAATGKPVQQVELGKAFAVYNSEVGPTCRTRTGGWSTKRIRLSHPSDPWCHWGGAVSLGKTASYWAAVTNYGSEENVSGPYTLCGVAPFGWEFDGTVTAYTRSGAAPKGLIVPAERVSHAYDPATRELCVTVEDDPANPGLAGRYSALRGPDQAWAIDVRVDGQFVPGGAPKLVWTGGHAAFEKCGEFVDEGFTKGCYGYTNGGHPSLKLTIDPDHALIGPQAELGYNIALDNHAYAADGTLLADGARGPATDVAVYQKVTRDGDYPTCAEGQVGTHFVSASSESGDATEIWISFEPDAPTGPAGATLDPENGWLLCADGGAACDAAALDALGYAVQDVQWVAYTLGTVLITDAEPRGVSTLFGGSLTNNKYEMRLVLKEDGTSEDEANVCSEGRFAGGNFAPAGLNPEEVMVQVEYSCGIGGYGDIEVCNGVDDDCDGEIDEGFEGTGQACDFGSGACTTTGMTVCNAQGTALTCLGEAPAPQVTTCGVGVCKSAGEATCTTDAWTDTCQPAAGLATDSVCDGLDNDCDGETDEDFDGVGIACTEGEPQCAAKGFVMCNDDGTGTQCTADVTTTNDAECDNGDICTRGDTCQAGGCTAGIFVDAEAPALQCPAPVFVEADADTCTAPVDLAATATDFCSPGTAQITDDAPGVYTPGDTHVSFIATDAPGNIAKCTTLVMVVDATSPQVTCNGPGQVQAAALPLEIEAVATDSCGVPSVGVQDIECAGCATSADAGRLTVTSAAPGTLITWKAIAMDEAGNSAQATCSLLVAGQDSPGAGTTGGTTVEDRPADLPNNNDDDTGIEDNRRTPADLDNTDLPAGTGDKNAADWQGEGSSEATVVANSAQGDGCSCTSFSNTPLRGGPAALVMLCLLGWFRMRRPGLSA